MTDKSLKILSNKPISKDCFDLRVLAENIGDVQPGQFCHIVCGEFTLRRPISVCMYNKSSFELRMIYRVAGEGTRWLSQRREGDFLQILLPLGNGFTVPETSRYPVFIGGGIGCPPMLYAAKSAVQGASAVLGFKSAGEVMLEDDFKRICGDENVYITTDDGSFGRHGLVTDILNSLISSGKCDYIAACGPKPMLKAIAAAAHLNNIKCEISLEERMGCAMGACLVCSVKIKGDDGKCSFKRVCRDGPVFDSERVVFE